MFKQTERPQNFLTIGRSRSSTELDAKLKQLGGRALTQDELKWYNHWGDAHGSGYADMSDYHLTRTPEWKAKYKAILKGLKLGDGKPTGRVSTRDWLDWVGTKDEFDEYQQKLKQRGGKWDTYSQEWKDNYQAMVDKMSGDGTSSKIAKVPKEYKNILKQTEKNIGHNGTTFSSELDRYGKKHIKNFKNSHSYNLMPRLKDKDCCIINLDHSDSSGSHWVSVIRDGKRLCVYDSFGRRSNDILSKLDTQGLKVVDSDYDPEQRVSETNCGFRCLAWLIYAQKHGIAKALMI